MTLKVPYYPRQAFAAPPHTWSQAELDYLGLIRTLIIEVNRLSGLIDVISDALLTEAGEFLLTEAGDTILYEAA